MRRLFTPAVIWVGVSLVLGADCLMPRSTALADADQEAPGAESVVKQTGIVLDIPGPWADREAFLAAFAKANGSSIRADGHNMLDAGGHAGAVFDVMAHDPKLANAIWIGTGRSLDPKTMDKITAHKSVVTLVVPPAGAGLEQRLTTFAGAVRKAGGYALRVHYSGLSHDWARWDKMLGGGMPAALFQTLVVQVPFRDKGRLCSFGMVQFGLPDACIADPGLDSDAAWVLFEFNSHLWQEQPKLKDGHTFARNRPGAQNYVLKLVADRRYPQGHEYVNPSGVWEMDPAP